MLYLIQSANLNYLQAVVLIDGPEWFELMKAKNTKTCGKSMMTSQNFQGYKTLYSFRIINFKQSDLLNKHNR